MICADCLSKPCPVARSVRSVIGTWARERGRQGLGLFGELRDQGAMDEAIQKPVADLIAARCNCQCHGGD